MKMKMKKLNLLNLFSSANDASSFLYSKFVTKE